MRNTELDSASQKKILTFVRIARQHNYFLKKASFGDK